MPITKNRQQLRDAMVKGELRDTRSVKHSDTQCADALLASAWPGGTRSSMDLTSPDGIPAATVVIFRNGPEGEPPEILMTIRSREMTFAGGMAVFPGGRVDPEDFELGAMIGGDLEPEEAAHQIAVVRETLEETGLVIGLSGDIDAAKAQAARRYLVQTGDLASVLDHFDWELDLAQLTPFARWYPKNEKLSRVYDTRFYLADLGTGAVDIAADQTENTHLFWISAQGALDAAERGEIKLIFPTRRNLERLARFADFAAAKAQAEAIAVRTITPVVTMRDGAGWLEIGEEYGYPVTGEPLDQVQRG